MSSKEKKTCPFLGGSERKQSTKRGLKWLLKSKLENWYHWEFCQPPPLGWEKVHIRKGFYSLSEISEHWLTDSMVLWVLTFYQTFQHQKKLRAKDWEKQAKYTTWNHPVPDYQKLRAREWERQTNSTWDCLGLAYRKWKEKNLYDNMRGLVAGFECREIDWLLICELGLCLSLPTSEKCECMVIFKETFL